MKRAGSCSGPRLSLGNACSASWSGGGNGPTSKMDQTMFASDGVVDLGAVGHEHRARADAGIQLPRRGRAAAEGISEQPDRRAGAARSAAIGYLRPHVTLGLGAAARLLEHLNFGLVAADQRRVQQLVAQQVD